MSQKKIFGAITTMNNGEEYLDLELIAEHELSDGKSLSDFLLEKYQKIHPEKATNIKSVKGYEITTINELDRFGYRSFCSRTRGHLFDCKLLEGISYDPETMELIFTAKISLAKFTTGTIISAG